MTKFVKPQGKKDEFNKSNRYTDKNGPHKVQSDRSKFTSAEEKNMKYNKNKPDANVKSYSSDAPEKKKVLTRDDRKDLKNKSRANRKFAAEEDQLKTLFQLNISTLSREQQIKEASKMIEVSKGKIFNLCQRRDSAKSIQLVIKYGTKELRQTILDEVKGKIRDLIKTHQGHFVVLSLARYAPLSHTILVQELQGSLHKLCTTNDGAQILDFLYASANEDVQYLILRELMDRAFAVLNHSISAIDTLKNSALLKEHTDKLKSDEINKILTELEPVVPDIRDVATWDEAMIKQHPEKLLAWLIAKEPSRRNNIFQQVEFLLQKVVDKEMLMYRFYHSILLQYLTIVPLAMGSKRHLMQEIVKYPLALAHSKEGARSYFFVFNHSNLKDRKRAAGFLKGRVLECAMSPTGYLIILSILHNIDDTPFLKNSILSELFSSSSSTDARNVAGEAPPIIQLLTSTNGSKIFTYVFNNVTTPNDQGHFLSGEYFSQDELSLFKPVFLPKWLLDKKAVLVQKDEDEVKDDVKTSKKKSAKEEADDETEKEKEALAQKEADLSAQSLLTEEELVLVKTTKKDYVDKIYDLAVLFVEPVLKAIMTTTPSQLFGFMEVGSLSRFNDMLKDDEESDKDEDNEDEDDSDNDEATLAAASTAQDDALSDDAVKVRHCIEQRQRALGFKESLKELPQLATLEALVKHNSASRVLYLLAASLSTRSIPIILPEDADNTHKTQTKYQPHYAKHVSLLEEFLENCTKLLTGAGTATGTPTITVFDASIDKKTFAKRQAEQRVNSLLYTTSYGLEVANTEHVLTHPKSHFFFKTLAVDSNKNTNQESILKAAKPFEIDGLSYEIRQTFMNNIIKALNVLKKEQPQIFEQLIQQNRAAYVLAYLTFFNPGANTAAVALLKPLFSKAQFTALNAAKSKTKLNAGLTLLLKALSGDVISNAKPVAIAAPVAAPAPAPTPQETPSKKRKTAPKVEEEEVEVTSPVKKVKRGGKAAEEEEEEKVFILDTPKRGRKAKVEATEEVRPLSPARRSTRLAKITPAEDEEEAVPVKRSTRSRK